MPGWDLGIIPRAPRSSTRIREKTDTPPEQTQAGTSRHHAHRRQEPDATEDRQDSGVAEPAVGRARSAEELRRLTGLQPPGRVSASACSRDWLPPLTIPCHRCETAPRLLPPGTPSTGDGALVDFYRDYRELFQQAWKIAVCLGFGETLHAR
jgi:hypothetical protein